MDDKEKINCFTAGELANLFGISKQTLLYYDKIGLLSPDYISSNGYRHYSIDQILILEIIINMRSLNISIVDIKDYLNNRSCNSFLKHLQKKEAECKKIIKENERICRSLQRLTNDLTTHNNLPMEQITVCWQEQRMLRLTELSSHDNSKTRICKFANHTKLVSHSRGFFEKQPGWIISQNDFFKAHNYNYSQAYFSFSENHSGHVKTPRVPLPTGLYLEIYFSGPFYKRADSLREKIASFMQINKFKACSDIHILPIETHWFNTSTTNYINMLFLRVENPPLKQ